MTSRRDGRPRNHRNLKTLLETEPRCIYCANTAADAKITLEHMPPISMFRERQRLKGMEYATCEACNNGTRGADVVAAFLARIGQDGTETDWQMQENQKLLSGVLQAAPGAIQELFDLEKGKTVLRPTPGGVLVEKVLIEANGPVLRAYKNVFAAKLAMALYREHVGVALPLDGQIDTVVYLNAGLAQSSAETMLSILPTGSTLSQGSKHVTEQFAYRYNTDGKEIVAALVGFHSNLHVFVMASANPVYEAIVRLPSSNRCRPGDLLAMLPKPRPLIMPGLPGWDARA